jgi:hypothetical protein
MRDVLPALGGNLAIIDRHDHAKLNPDALAGTFALGN